MQRRKARAAPHFLLVYLGPFGEDDKGHPMASLTVEHLSAGTLAAPWRRTKGGRWKTRVRADRLPEILRELGERMGGWR